MKKRIIICLCILMTAGCMQNNISNSTEPEPSDLKEEIISFDAFIKEGETFHFEFDPNEAVSYEELKKNIVEDELTAENWDRYFEVKDVYREHYEYDEHGNPTSTYMKGNTMSVILKDDYYYADNWTRNGLEFSVFVDGYETRTMNNDGVVYEPVTVIYQENRNFTGADLMLILTDFVNSWDETTVEEYKGQLNSYEIVNASGKLKLLDASAVNFRKYKDDIWYFAAYQSADEYFVIFVQTDDNQIDREKEYDGVAYHTADERYDGYQKITVWQMIIEMLKAVEEN